MRQTTIHRQSYINLKKECKLFVKELKSYVPDCKKSKKEANLISRFEQLMTRVFEMKLFDKKEHPVQVTEYKDKETHRSEKSADMVYADVLIEFETELGKSKKMHAESQLRDYLSGLHNSNKSREHYKAFISDGITFIRYRYTYDQRKKGNLTANDIELFVHLEFDLDHKTKNGDSLPDKEIHMLFREELMPGEGFEIELQNAHELFMPVK